MWAKIRCGNVGRAYKEGYKEWTCRLCEWEHETVEHFLICREATRIQSERTKRKRATKTMERESW